MTKTIGNKAYPDSKKAGLIILFLLINHLTINSQTFSDTVKIPEITIHEKYTPDITGLKETKIDSVILSHYAISSLSDLLSENSTIFIKSLGPGKSASSSLRGAGANHTQVLWNGININSSMLGQADFSLSPNLLIDEISISHGGASLSNNNGAFGGSVNLLNKPDWNRKLDLNLSQYIGSYGTYNSTISAFGGNKKFQTGTRAFYTQSENNYIYKPYDGAPDEINKNGKYSGYGILQEIYYRINEKNLLSAALWGQNNNNNQEKNEFSENIKVEFIRTFLDWNYTGEKWNISIRSAYQNNSMNYKNQNLIDSRNKEFKFSNFAGFIYSISNSIKFISNLNADNIKVKTNNYLDTTSIFSDTSNVSNSDSFSTDTSVIRNTVSFSAGFNTNFFQEKLKMIFLIKQEISGKKIIPVIPSFGINYKLFSDKELHLKANISRNFHQPSMNDLYWVPGGNLNLVPEEGYFIEAGIAYSLKSKNEKQNFFVEFTSFYSRIKNNIIWIQITPANWVATNLKNVVSKGIEVLLKYNVKFYGWLLNINCNYSFTDSRNTGRIDSSDQSVGKQLIYVPFHIFNSNFQISYRQFFAGYTFSYTGKRYSTSDNSWYMPPYILSNVVIGKKFKLKNNSLLLQGIITNLFDRDYQIKSGYPMMRRSFKIAVKLNFSS